MIYEYHTKVDRKAGSKSIGPTAKVSVFLEIFLKKKQESHCAYVSDLLIVRNKKRNVINHQLPRFVYSEPCDNSVVNQSDFISYVFLYFKFIITAWTTKSVISKLIRNDVTPSAIGCKNMFTTQKLTWNNNTCFHK